MFPGLTPVGSISIAELPSAYDLSVPNPFNALLANPLLERAYLLVAQPYDVVNSTSVTAYLSSTEYQTKPTDTPANQLFHARLQSPYNVTLSLYQPGKVGGSSEPGFGDIAIINTDGLLDNLINYSWNGRPLTVYLGQKGDSFSNFTPIFQGTTSGITSDEQQLNLKLKDYQHLFSVPVQSSLYRGTQNAVSFNGTNQYGSVTLTCPAGSMSMEAWFKTSANNTFVVLANYRNGSGNPGQRILLFNSTTANTIEFNAINDSSTLFQATGPVVSKDVWHLASGVLDTTGGFIYLYVDGVQVAKTAITGTFNTVLSAFEVARRTAADLYFPGQLDDLRIWNTALTQSQIASNMNHELTGTETGLYADWTFNDNSGSSVTDITAGAHTLTLNNSPTWVSSLEGGPDVSGKPKPLVYGNCKQVPAVLIDSTRLIYQVHDRSVLAIDAVYDKGNALTFTTNYTVDTTKGLITLVTAPAGQITADVRGDNTGSYVNTTADVIRRIATRHAGLADPAGIDTGAFAALNAINSGVVGYSTNLSAVNISQALDDIIATVGGYWTFTRLGLLTVSQLQAPNNPIVTFTEADISINSLTLLEVIDPSKRQRVGYHKIWKTQKPAELATSLSQATISQFGQDFSFAEAENPAVLTGFPLAADVETETYFNLLSDAQKEATRRQTLYGVQRFVFKVTLTHGLFQYFLGNTVAINYSQAAPPQGSLINRLGLTGDLFVIVGITENVSAGGNTPDELTLELWG
jgi:Concanavalin A-like lectin/glucanases superfamily